MSCSDARISLSPRRTTAWSSAIRTLMSALPTVVNAQSLLQAKRNGHPDLGSLVSGSGDIYASPKRQDTLSHAQQSQRLGAEHGGFVYAFAVILDLQDESAGLEMHRNIHARRIGMARSVGKQFLKDPEGRGRPLPVEHGISAQTQPASDAAALLEFLRLPFDSGREAQLVQYLRTQAGGDLAHGLNRAVDQIEHRLGLRRHRPLLGRQLLGKPGEIHLQTRQRLAQLIVDLACDPRRLL